MVCVYPNMTLMMVSALRRTPRRVRGSQPWQSSAMPVKALAPRPAMGIRASVNPLLSVAYSNRREGHQTAAASLSLPLDAEAPSPITEGGGRGAHGCLGGTVAEFAGESPAVAKHQVLRQMWALLQLRPVPRTSGVMTAVSTAQRFVGLRIRVHATPPSLRPHR